ncbi:MAG TPA: mechanosensitive ion channel family protein [Actinomycetes bacterium]|nr:mechanosensitive ion channel family protein [Actinomycetes bacterium]
MLRNDDFTVDDVTTWLNDTPLGRLVTIVTIIVAAIVVRWLWRRFVRRTTATVTDSAIAQRLAGVDGTTNSDRLLIERHRARANAVAGLLVSTGTFIIVVVAVLFGLAQLGLNITPLIASAGVAGIAIGFGAQTIIRDFLSGVFMIMENQYGVGDVISVNGITGTVEEVGLRVTRLRDVEGTLWYVANGSVTELGNRSQGWSLAVVDVPIGYGADLVEAKKVLLQAALDIQADERWANRIMSDEPQVAVESMTAAGVTVRIRLHTTHDQQLSVARELRVRAVKALAAAGVSAPTPVIPEPPATA